MKNSGGDENSHSALNLSNSGSTGSGGSIGRIGSCPPTNKTDDATTTFGMISSDLISRPASCYISDKNQSVRDAVVAQRYSTRLKIRSCGFESHQLQLLLVLLYFNI